LFPPPHGHSAVHPSVIPQCIPPSFRSASLRHSAVHPSVIPSLSRNLSKICHFERSEAESRNLLRNVFAGLNILWPENFSAPILSPRAQSRGLLRTVIARPERPQQSQWFVILNVVKNLFFHRSLLAPALQGVFAVIFSSRVSRGVTQTAQTGNDLPANILA